LLAQCLYRSNQPAGATVELNRAESYAEYRAASLHSRAINAIMLRQPAMALALMRRCDPPEGGSDPVDPKELFSAAASAQRLDTMSEVLEKYRREAPLSPAMNKVLALGYVKAGRASDGLMILQLLAGQMPEDPEVWLLLGDISMEMERRDWATSFYKEHLRRLPDSPFAAEIEAKLGTKP
jgi:predicted Zn-dependent protease